MQISPKPHLGNYSGFVEGHSLLWAITFLAKTDVENKNKESSYRSAYGSFDFIWMFY